MPKSNYRSGRSFHNTFRPPGYEEPCRSGMKRDFIFNSNDARQGHCIAYKEARDNIPTQVETEDYYIWRNSAPPNTPHPVAPKEGYGIALIGTGSVFTFIFLIVTIRTMLYHGLVAIVPGLITVGCILMIVFGDLMMKDTAKESSDKNAEIDATNAKNNSDYAAGKPTESYEIYIAPPTLTTLATPTSPTI